MSAAELQNLQHHFSGYLYRTSSRPCRHALKAIESSLPEPLQPLVACLSTDPSLPTKRGNVCVRSQHVEYELMTRLHNCRPSPRHLSNEPRIVGLRKKREVLPLSWRKCVTYVMARHPLRVSPSRNGLGRVSTGFLTRWASGSRLFSDDALDVVQGWPLSLLILDHSHDQLIHGLVLTWWVIAMRTDSVWRRKHATQHLNPADS